MAFSQVNFNRYEYWSRLVALIEEEGGSVCKFILHTEMGVPTEEEEMYKYLLNFKTNIRRSNMSLYQKRVLLPEDGRIDKTKLDIALYTHLINMMGKKEMYPRIEWLRFKRNELMHMKKDLPVLAFNHLWDEKSQALNSLQSEDYKRTLIPRKGNAG